MLSDVQVLRRPPRPVFTTRTCPYSYQSTCQELGVPTTRGSSLSATTRWIAVVDSVMGPPPPPRPAPLPLTTSSQPCMLAAFDTDGTGRRLESSLICAATAHVLGNHFACAPARRATRPRYRSQRRPDVGICSPVVRMRPRRQMSTPILQRLSTARAQPPPTRCSTWPRSTCPSQ